MITINRQSTADGVDTLYSSEYGQTFHSIHGALIEAEHVFLNGTGVKQRLLTGQPTCILEVGFGTGLNFWLTAHYSRLYDAPVHYVALENQLLPASIIAQLNHGQQCATIRDIRQDWLVWREKLPTPLPPAIWEWTVTGLHLELVIGEATTVELPSRPYQAIYQDAFSPAANPELWQPTFLAKLYRYLQPGGKLATYSVKRSVRQALQAVGFQVHKEPGPPGKREMLVADRPKC